MKRFFLIVAVYLWGNANCSLAQDVQLRTGTDSLHSLAVSHHGKYVSASSASNTYYWNMHFPEKAPVDLGDPRGGITFSHDSAYIAGFRGRSAIIWNIERHREQSRPSPGVEVRSVAFAPQGYMLALGCADRSVRFYNLDGNSLGQMDGLPRIAGSLAFSHDGRFLAAKCPDRDGLSSVQVYRYPERDLHMEIEGDGRYASVIAFAHLEPRLAVGTRMLPGHDPLLGPLMIEIYDVSGQKITRRITLPAGLVGPMAFSRDDRYLAVTCALYDPNRVLRHVDHSVQIFDTLSGMLSAKLDGFASGIAFSPDGTLFLLREKSIDVWRDWRTWREPIPGEKR